MPDEAYIFDAIRTPRGRGKTDGALHDLPPVDLLVTLFHALAARTHLATAQVGDILLGVVTPLGQAPRLKPCRTAPASTRMAIGRVPPVIVPTRSFAGKPFHSASHTPASW